MIDYHAILKQKTELLCNGLYLDETFVKYHEEQGISYGRKGGAGPLGGRYFILEDNKTLVNVALWNDKKRSNLILKEFKNGYFEVHDERKKTFFSKLKLIKNPKYYSDEFKTSDGIPMKKIALVHGINCLATTIYQKCKYWACGEACKFCGIELSLEYDTTVAEKNYNQINEVINVAKAEGRCSHMTLTSGTPEDDDKGASRYIELLKGVKEVHPDIPLHVQIEPIENIEFINKLKEAGADTIGIHLEILSDSLRREITPGKYKIPYKLFEENWEQALNVFGRNQVDSYILTGFEESTDEIFDALEKIVMLGVIPFITPVRSIPGLKDLPLTKPENLLKIYIHAGELMKEYDVNPLENKAGCVRCGGCSAIKEAYKATYF